MQYQYYKGPEKKGVWRALQRELLAERIDAPRIAFTTILSVNEKIGRKEAVSDEALYHGPFYIDIDSDDIKKSIKTAKKILAKLNKNGIPDSDIQLWASGKRGFHFMIPMSVFANDAPTRKLPLAYGYMAAAIKLFDMKEVDKTVYNHGRGRMWRVANKKRIDNGAYKVGITAKELREIDEEKYAAICSEPREPIPFEPTGKKNAFFSALFARSLARAHDAIKPVQVYIDPDIVNGLQGTFPPCAEAMAHAENLDENKGYNEISTQFGKAVATFKPDTAEEVINEFANVMTGDSYNTPEKRSEHTMKAYRIAARTKDYAWSCRSMLSVLKDKTSPCLECPIAFLLVQQDDAIEEAAAQREIENESKRDAINKRALDKNHAEHSGRTGNGVAHPSEHPKTNGIRTELKPDSDFGGVSGERIQRQSDDELERRAGEINSAENGEADDAANETSETSENEYSSDADTEFLASNTEGLLGNEEGYGFVNADGDFRRICNFTLSFKSVFIEFVENFRQDRRSAVSADVIIRNKISGRVLLEEPAWNSKSSFISYFSGIANAGFYGKDDDVQRMKIALMQDIEKRAENIRRVTSIGIHRQKVGDQVVYTYVEPGYSINNFGMENYYQLMGQIPASPKLQKESFPTHGDPELTKALLSVLGTNTDIKIAQIAGWFGACFLKQHIHAEFNQFPLLGFGGAAGSGKTNIATLLACLHGIDYRGEFSPMSLPQASAFAVWKSIKDTMTVPRIMEEYNKSKIPRNFTAFGEVFKDCWNQFAVQRGTLSNAKRHGDNQVGAHLTEFPLTAPVVVISEQAVTMPALVERMIQIPFTKSDLDQPNVRANFEFAVKQKEVLKRFAKAAYMQAVMTSSSDAAEMIQKYRDQVPADIGDRPQFSYCVALAGLDFIRAVSDSYGLEIHDRLDQLRDALLGMLKHDVLMLAMVKQRSEVDIVMEKLTTMAAMSDNEGSTAWLVEHIHYIRDEKFLYLDGLVAHAQYRSFCRLDNSIAVIEEFNQFRSLLRGESYAEDLNVIVDDFARGRPVFKLNLAKMAEKGIEISAFLAG